VGAGDGAFHSAAHAFVVVFLVSDVCAVRSVRRIAAAEREYDVFGVYI
jgi:hypothetical protein